MNIDWNKFELDNANNDGEPGPLFETFSTRVDTLEEVELYHLLYVELLPELKYGFKSVFSITEKFIEVIDQVFKESDNIANKVILFDFFTVLFRDFARSEYKIMVYPFPFMVGYDSYSENDLELSLYNKMFYIADHELTLLEEDEFFGQFIYYVYFFGKYALTKETYDGIISKNSLPDDAYITLILGELLRATVLETMFMDHTVISRIRNENHRTLIEHIYAAYIDKSDLGDKLKLYMNSTVELETIWGNGYYSILMTSFIARNKQIDQTVLFKEAIEIYKRYEQAMLDIDPNMVPDFPPHKYLMEDLTAIIFKEQWGNGNIVSPDSLSDYQQWVLNQLNRELKIHTHSLLFCGILPQGITQEEMERTGDPYSVLQ